MEKGGKMIKKVVVLISILMLAMFFTVSCVTSEAQSAETKANEVVAEQASTAGEFSDIRIRFFCGGDEGDIFANTVYTGAKAAQRDLGCQVEYLFSGWQAEKMTQQLRESIATKPDGISMMGHPGASALDPLVKEAQDLGIKITLVDVDVPEIMEKYNTGYVGTFISEFGYRLGTRAIEKFGIKSGDTVIIDGNWGEPGLEKRDLGVEKAFVEIGAKIVRIKHPLEAYSNTDLFQPIVAGAIAGNPEAKLICYSGGQMLGACGYYMESIGKKPGEIINIGFDLSPQIIESIESGYANLCIDGQPYYEGYLPIVSLCSAIKYGLALITVDTGTGFVDETNYKEVAEYAKAGFR